MIQEYFKLAFKNLKHRGVRSWLTLLGIFVGVMAVVSLMSLGTALQMAVSSQFGISQTELLTIQAGGATSFGPPGEGVVDPLGERELKAIDGISSVKRAVGRFIKPVKIEYNDYVAFSFAADIPSGDDGDFVYEQMDIKPEKGRLLEDSDSGKVLLGYSFYKDKMGFNKPILPGRNILINNEEFEVVGIMEKKGSFTIDNSVMLSTGDLKDLLELEDEFSLIAAQPISKDYIDRAKIQIEKELRRIRDVEEGEEDFEISTPDSALDSLNGILGGIKAFIAIVAGISILIGALGIVNTMTTSVLERKTDIGIMKSVGARNEHIFLQFFIESSLLGLVGGIVGTIFGLLIGILGVAGLSNLLGADIAPSIDMMLIFFTLVGSFIIGGLSGIVPAMNAAKQNPVDALRG